MSRVQESDPGLQKVALESMSDNLFKYTHGLLFAWELDFRDSHKNPEESGRQCFCGTCSLQYDTGACCGRSGTSVFSAFVVSGSTKVDHEWCQGVLVYYLLILELIICNLAASQNMKEKKGLAIDPRTHMVLFKMLNRGVFHEMNGCISTGKEANVYHATKYDGQELAIKVSFGSEILCAVALVSRCRIISEKKKNYLDRLNAFSLTICGDNSEFLVSMKCFPDFQVIPASRVVGPGQVADLDTTEQLVEGVSQTWWFEDNHDKEALLKVVVRELFVRDKKPYSTVTSLLLVQSNAD
ncbi:hypothetical protein POM88_035847 [Heracleum sosnowskyi]|uniref:IP5PC-F immunoglobulin-like domain-containing protein n=1 Tax=Heracleum sosnowskyi TaxID=360622 RepID=A0AAD8HM33_9APIA|nr:hypothetical protein POM88_035847 [Heracleum sosnowskyi]